MCFSATASFIASAFLGVAGVVAMRKVKTPSLFLFSGIPFFFSIQQLSEGFIWLSLKNPDFVGWQEIPMYIFLSFALIVWPILVPVSIMLPENNSKRKKFLKALSFSGIILSAIMRYCLLFGNVTASILSFRIHYAIDYPLNISQYSGLYYFIPTVIPLFVSSIKRMHLFGLTIFVSYVVTQIFFKENVVSVWCFFPAIISVAIILIVEKHNWMVQ
jgi:hypothetical protein